MPKTKPELGKQSAVNITLYDLSGAPLHPRVLDELIGLVQKLAHEEKLVYNLVTG